MKIARFAIFLTGMVGLGIGGIMSISSLESQQEQAAIRANENLKTQAQIFVDQFFSVLESAKNPNANLSYVTHRGTVKLLQGVPNEVEALNPVSKNAKADDTDLALDDRVLKALKNQIAIGDLKISKVSYGTYPMSDLSSREGIFVATPLYKTSAKGEVDPSIIDRISVTLIDPAKAMPAFARATAGNRTSYLIDKNGRVLAHSTQAFVGTDLKKIEGLKETLDNLFLGAQTGTMTRYRAIDGTREQVAFVRAGTTPFAIAAEQPSIKPVMSWAWFSEQLDSGAARKSLGMMMVLIAAALALFSAISFALNRQIQRQIQSRAASTAADASLGGFVSPTETSLEDLQNLRTLLATPSMGSAIAQATEAAESTAKVELETAATGLSSTLPTAPASIQNAAQAFVENRVQLVDAREEAEASARAVSSQRDRLKDFSERMQKAYTIEAIEKELVQVSSELSNSPVLYFRYHRRSQTIHLAALAGQVQIPNYAHLQAYVRKDIEQQVETLAGEGKVASITHYGPISKLMIANLNIANYEAWTITSDPEVSGQSRLVGVMVVVQPIFTGPQSRPILAKVLREAGNYLYAQGNKLKPRYHHPEHELDLTTPGDAPSNV